MLGDSTGMAIKDGRMTVVKFCLVCCLALLAGCATTARYEAKLASWVGSPETDLIRSWGAPQQVYEAANGSKFLTYSNSRQVYFRGTPPTYTTTYDPDTRSSTTTSSGGIDPQLYTMDCQTTFEVANGKVAGWSWKGNDCVSQ